MEFFCPEEMALNQQDRDWVKLTVGESLRTHSRGRMERVKSWSPLGSVVAIALFVLLQWGQYVEFRTHTGDRLDSIEAGLRVLQAAQIPGKVLKELVNLPPKKFALNLPALRKVAEQPIKEVQAEPVALTEITKRLRSTDQASQEYWPTVLQFLSFASTVKSDPRVPPRSAPAISIYELFKRPSNIPPGSAWARKLPPMSETVYLFDSVPEDTVVRNFHFVRCRIIFTSTPIPMENVTFEDCVFDFPGTEVPNNYLQRAGEALLANTNIQNVTITAL